MKGMDLFCASPASTAICSSMEHRYSMVRRGPSRPEVDHHRHNPHLHGRRKTQFHSHVPCTSVSQLPIYPKPYHEKHRRSSAKQSDLRRKNTAGIRDLNIKDLNRASGSSRYLLTDTPLLDLLSESTEPISHALVPVETPKPRPRLSSNDSPALKLSESELPISYALVPVETAKPRPPRLSSNDSPALKLSESELPISYALVPVETAKPRPPRLSSNDSPALKSSSSSRSHEQVVVLRVSLHCKGCEGKVRKHISKMEGVRSFSIDLETKKVTVIGDVTPLGVLASVSKVKNAQLWPSPTSSSTSPLPSSRWSA